MSLNDLSFHVIPLPVNHLVSVHDYVLQTFALSVRVPAD